MKITRMMEMNRLLAMAFLCPSLAFSTISPMIDIKAQIVTLQAIPGLYLLKWDGTYWAQLEVLEMGDGDVEENQKEEPKIDPTFRPDTKDSQFYLD